MSSPGGRVVGAHRADDHVARDPVRLRGVDQLHRAAEIDRLLALGAAPGTGARGEHDRVGARDRAGDVGVFGLEVAQHRLGADRLEVGGVIGVADQPPRAIAALGEQPQQAASDLPVAPGDGYIHGPSISTLGPRAARRRPGESGVPSAAESRLNIIARVQSDISLMRRRVPGIAAR